MLNYKKGKNVEEELSKDNIPIECLPKDFLWMHVKGGTTVSNVIDYAKLEFDKGAHRTVVWSGCGGGVTKTISCAEIFKRNYDIHQVTRLSYQNVHEFWDPVREGLEPIVAKRTIPSVHVLLSLDEIDPKTPGYQHSKDKTKFSMEPDNSIRSNNNQQQVHKGQAGGSSKSSKSKNFHTGNRKPKSKEQLTKRTDDGTTKTKNNTE